MLPETPKKKKKNHKIFAFIVDKICSYSFVSRLQTMQLLKNKKKNPLGHTSLVSNSLIPRVKTNSSPYTNVVYGLELVLTFGT
jgi:hypothetical protein